MTTKKSYRDKWASVTLSREVIKKLRLLAHPGQSLDGVVSELIQKVRK